MKKLWLTIVRRPLLFAYVISFIIDLVSWIWIFHDRIQYFTSQRQFFYFIFGH